MRPVWRHGNPQSSTFNPLINGKKFRLLRTYSGGKSDRYKLGHGTKERIKRAKKRRRNHVGNNVKCQQSVRLRRRAMRCASPAWGRLGSREQMRWWRRCGVWPGWETGCSRHNRRDLQRPRARVGNGARGSRSG